MKVWIYDVQDGCVEGCYASIEAALKDLHLPADTPILTNEDNGRRYVEFDEWGPELTEWDVTE